MIRCYACAVMHEHRDQENNILKEQVMAKINITPQVAAQRIKDHTVKGSLIEEKEIVSFILTGLQVDAFSNLKNTVQSQITSLLGTSVGVKVSPVESNNDQVVVQLTDKALINYYDIQARGSFEFRVGKFMDALFADEVSFDDRIDAAKAINVALGVSEDDEVIKQYADNKKGFFNKLTAGIRTHEKYKPDNLADLIEGAVQANPSLPDNNPLKTYKSQARVMEAAQQLSAKR
jgi:hypothetical protein